METLYITVEQYKLCVWYLVYETECKISVLQFKWELPLTGRLLCLMGFLTTNLPLFLND